MIWPLQVKNEAEELLLLDSETPMSSSYSLCSSKI